MMERLSCPSHGDWVDVDQAVFTAAVECDRCPLSGVPLEASERAGAGSSGGVARLTVGWCPTSSGGCGAQWSADGGVVSWWGREVALDFDWPEEEGAVVVEGDGG